MTNDRSSHIRFGYGSSNMPSSKSEYTESYLGKQSVPGRVSCDHMSKRNPITMCEDYDCSRAWKSASQDAFPLHVVTDFGVNECKKVRTESHFIMGYTHGPFVDSEYSEKFKSRGFPSAPMNSRNNHLRDPPPFFASECDGSDYTSESKRAFKIPHGYSSQPAHNSSRAKLGGSNFTLGPASVDPVTLSTSHSHYAKRSGLGKGRRDPEIIALKEELSKSHFSLCDDG
jgi:hypothetical protein